MLKRIIADSLQGITSDDRRVVLRQADDLLHGRLDARRFALETQMVKDENQDYGTRWGGGTTEVDHG